MRVIAGTAKGRRLTAPRGRSTRPMTGRAREALFSALGDAVGGDVLDLFAGSGSLGIEALSRGAASAVFVDGGRAAITALRHNLEACGFDGMIIEAEVAAGLRSLADMSFDLVFVDPPFDMPASEIASLFGDLKKLLKAGATVVLHRRTGDAEVALPPGWSEISRRRYGDSTLWRYRTP